MAAILIFTSGYGMYIGIVLATDVFASLTFLHTRTALSVLLGKIDVKKHR